MVGCWFTGQGKKGDCVGKKVNDGPVLLTLSIPTADQLHIIFIWLHEDLQGLQFMPDLKDKALIEDS